MSIEAVAHVLRAPIGGNAKVVLLGIANHADADFGNARPTIETLAVYAHCDRRTVQRCLQQLEREGFVQRQGLHAVGGQANRQVTVWQVVRVGWQNATPVGGRDGTSGTGGMAPAPSEPSLRTVHTPTQRVVVAPARACAQGPELPTWKFNGKQVPAPMRELALSLLAEYHKRSGQRCKPMRASGKPSDALLRITGALLDHAEVPAEQWHAMLAWTMEHPWWSGTASVGAVFGPAVVARNLASVGKGGEAVVVERGDAVLAELFATAGGD